MIYGFRHGSVIDENDSCEVSERHYQSVYARIKEFNEVPDVANSTAVLSWQFLALFVLLDVRHEQVY